MNNEKSQNGLRRLGSLGTPIGVRFNNKDKRLLLLLHHFREITFQNCTLWYPNKKILYASFANKIRKWETKKRLSSITSRPLHTGVYFLKTKLIHKIGRDLMH